MNNSLYHLCKILSCPSQIHIHAFPVFKSKHSESWHSTGQYRYKPHTFVNSPQQDVMILMTGSHHGGHVSQQETSQVKHVPSLLINSLATCCHLTLLGIATYLLPLLFLHFLSLFVTNSHTKTYTLYSDKQILTCALGDVSKDALYYHQNFKWTAGARRRQKVSDIGQQCMAKLRISKIEKRMCLCNYCIWKKHGDEGNLY